MQEVEIACILFPRRLAGMDRRTTLRPYLGEVLSTQGATNNASVNVSVDIDDKMEKHRNR